LSVYTAVIEPLTDDDDTLEALYDLTDLMIWPMITSFKIHENLLNHQM
jgi:hypothetical protein